MSSIFQSRKISLQIANLIRREGPVSNEPVQVRYGRSTVRQDRASVRRCACLLLIAPAVCSLDAFSRTEASTLQPVQCTRVLISKGVCPPAQGCVSASYPSALLRRFQPSAQYIDHRS